MQPTQQREIKAAATEERAMSHAATGRTPHPDAPGVTAGVDESLVRSVVGVFYAKVRLDPVLGPIFEGAVAERRSRRLAPRPRPKCSAPARRVAESLRLGVEMKRGAA